MRPSSQFSLDQVVIGHSSRMRAIFDFVKVVSKSDSSVIITGESGTGKEVIANMLHHASARRHQPFVAVSCALFSETLIETELFGHERGAFTGAIKDKPGRFELAQGGTLFLDDIDDVPQGVQAKLLRVLESRQVMRVGGTAAFPIDVRLISASKADLRELVRRGLFRSDLYYRLNVCPVSIPPLRERRGDVPLLVEHFLRRFAPDRRVTVVPEAERALAAYDWPGNIRELRNIVQRLALFADGQIALGDLPPEIHDGHPVELLVKACARCMVDEAMSYTDVVACLETNLLRHALAEAGGNRTQAARQLGLSLSTLRDKLKKHGLDNGAD